MRISFLLAGHFSSLENYKVLDAKTRDGKKPHLFHDTSAKYKRNTQLAILLLHIHIRKLVGFIEPCLKVSYFCKFFHGTETFRSSKFVKNASFEQTWVVLESL